MDNQLYDLHRSVTQRAHGTGLQPFSGTDPMEPRATLPAKITLPGSFLEAKSEIVFCIAPRTESRRQVRSTFPSRPFQDLTLNRNNFELATRRASRLGSPGTAVNAAEFDHCTSPSC